MAGTGHVVGRKVILQEWQRPLETGIELHRQGDQVYQRRLLTTL